jgi:hypothetical protein
MSSDLERGRKPRELYLLRHSPAAIRHQDLRERKVKEREKERENIVSVYIFYYILHSVLLSVFIITISVKLTLTTL